MARYDFSKKDINSSSLHIAYQIASFIQKQGDHIIEKSISEQLKFFIQINNGMLYSDHKLHLVFGNTISKTDISRIFYKYLVKYVNNDFNSHIEKQFLEVLLSVFWNCTDSSIPLCESLLSLEGFNDVLIKIIDEQRFDSEKIKWSCVSILNNICCKKDYAQLFMKYNISDKLFELSTQPNVQRDMRILCVCVGFYVLTPSKRFEKRRFVESIQDDVIEILDNASNAKDYISDGYTMRELLGIMNFFCGCGLMREYATQNRTLRSTLLRVLGKRERVESVVHLAATIYGKTQQRQFRKLFCDKHDDHEEVLQYFNSREFGCSD